MRPAAQRLEEFVGDPERHRAFFGALRARGSSLVVAWRERRCARLAFEHLNAYWLRDIGIERRPPDTSLDQIRLGRRMWF
jgi:uncharacterized protein YjiS (DUF1127 family)